mmetsp:Transcript_13821/g.43681  ORF Transcript_13821/g.43681 Transcript_13821/m.43681 type:complete len:243 (+) Transcript_13821:86-814(+)
MLHENEARHAKALTAELDSAIERLAKETTHERRTDDDGYLSPLLLKGDDEPERQQHFVVVSPSVETLKRPREEAGPSADAHVQVPAAARTGADDAVEKSKAALSKMHRAGDPARRRVIRLDETPPSQSRPAKHRAEQHPQPEQPKQPQQQQPEKKKKKWSLDMVFGDKLNLVDHDKRDILEAFLDKRPKPPSSDINRIKIHEETTTDEASGAVTKTTFYVLLDWDKYSYQKTRKQKVVAKSQ